LVKEIWKQIVDDNYNTNKPNIFYSHTEGSSQFFKGVMWAAKAAKTGYEWKIDDGKKVKFWEDNWLGTSSLAIQYWDLYTIMNEQNKTVYELWDGTNLKCTFRRTVDAAMVRKWDEILQLASTIVFHNTPDEMVWTFNSNGVYFYQTLYKVIKFRGVKPIHTPVVWSLKIPPGSTFSFGYLLKIKL
jgi:hypothetical protein